MTDPGTGSGLPAIYCTVGLESTDLAAGPWLSMLCHSAVALDLAGYANGYLWADTTGDSLSNDDCTGSAVKIGGGAWTDEGGGWYSFGADVAGFGAGTYACVGTPTKSTGWGVSTSSSTWNGSVLVGSAGGRTLYASVVYVGAIAQGALPTPSSVRFSDDLAPNDDPPATTTTTVPPTTTTTEPCPEPPECGDCVVTCEAAEPDPTLPPAIVVLGAISCFVAGFAIVKGVLG